MKTVFTAKELGEALKNNEDTIEIQGNLVTKTVRIRATGKVAWVVAFGAIGVAFYSIVTAPASAPATGGSAQMAGFTAAGIGAASTLGASTTATAIAIAVAAGGIGSLTSLRKYKEISRSEDRLVLKRK